MVKGGLKKLFGRLIETTERDDKRRLYSIIQKR
jgi:hypothetical protein